MQQIYGSKPILDFTLTTQATCTHELCLMAVDSSHINNFSNNKGMLTFVSALQVGNLDMKPILIPNKQSKAKRQWNSLASLGGMLCSGTWLSTLLAVASLTIQRLSKAVAHVTGTQIKNKLGTSNKHEHSHIILIF